MRLGLARGSEPNPGHGRRDSGSNESHQTVTTVLGCRRSSAPPRGHHDRRAGLADRADCHFLTRDRHGSTLGSANAAPERCRFIRTRGRGEPGGRLWTHGDRLRRRQRQCGSGGDESRWLAHFSGTPFDRCRAGELERGYRDLRSWSLVVGSDVRERRPCDRASR